MIYLVKLFDDSGRLRCKDNFEACSPEDALLAAAKMYPRFAPELDGKRLAIGSVVGVAAESTDGPGFLKRRKKKHKQIKQKRKKSEVPPEIEAPLVQLEQDD